MNNNKSVLYDIDADFELSLLKVKEMYSTGKLFIHPTDTLYSLGGNPFSKQIITRLSNIFEENFYANITLLVDSISSLLQYVELESEKHLDLLISVWPNPVNVIFNLKPVLYDVLGYNKAAFRIPNNRFCLRLLAEKKRPLLSMNIEHNGHETNKSYELLKYEYMDKVDAIFFTNKETFVKESTIIDLSESRPVVVGEHNKQMGNVLAQYY